MRPHRSKGQIVPKVSTMPRAKTEAAAYLEIYKLVNEKKRLQHELEQLEQRREIIQKRLEVLTQQVDNLETSAHHLRDQPSESVKPTQPSVPAKPSGTKPIAHKPASGTEDFKTFFLEF